MPADFRFVSNEVQLWTPGRVLAGRPRRRPPPQQQLADAGRLKPGAIVGTGAAADRRPQRPQPRPLPALQGAPRSTPASAPTSSASTDDLVSEHRGGTLWLLWAFVPFVLLIGALNVANLVSVRATAQLRELVTRLALGASARRADAADPHRGAVLSALGGRPGLASAGGRCGRRRCWGSTRCRAAPRSASTAGSPAYTLALVAVVGMLVAIVPVLRLRHVDCRRRFARKGAAARPRAARASCAVCWSPARWRSRSCCSSAPACCWRASIASSPINPGFRPEGVLTGRISLPASRYGDDQAVRAAYDRLLPALRGHPGRDRGRPHRLAAVRRRLQRQRHPRRGLPDGAGRIGDLAVADHTSPRASSMPWACAGRAAGPSPPPTAGAPRAALVRRAAGAALLARPGSDRPADVPAERSQRSAEAAADDSWLTVVGVVGDMRLRASPTAASTSLSGAYYFPFRQHRRPRPSIVHSDGAGARGADLGRPPRVRGIDPAVPLYDVRTLQDRVDGALTDRRTPMILAVAFAVVALLLAAIGIYGVLAYQVAQRRREIGIRMALGASAPGIFEMVLREGALVVGAGAALGLAGAWLLRQTMQGAALRGGRDGPARDRRGRPRAAGRRAGRLRAAGAARVEGGSGGCADGMSARRRGVRAAVLAGSRSAARRAQRAQLHHRGGTAGRRGRAGAGGERAERHRPPAAGALPGRERAHGRSASASPSAPPARA